LRKKAYIFLLIILILISILVFLFITRYNNSSNIIGKITCVKDEKTAIKIAEATLEPIYGDLSNEKPLIANYDSTRKVWIVTGTLPDGYLGGVAEIIIREKDAKILKITHGK
jgi:hypothetical protein